MSDEHHDEPVIQRSESASELLTTPRLGEDKRGVALSVLWWVEGDAEEDERA